MLIEILVKKLPLVCLTLGFVPMRLSLIIGLDAGGGLDDETYSAYDKPWRAAETTAQSIYRPSKNLDSEIYGTDLDRIISTNRFVPDKGFSGADDASKRSGPVQFERSEEDDPFGLGQLLRSVKEQKKRPADGSDSGSNKVREQATNKKVQKKKSKIIRKDW
ncbi:SNW domain-containing protein 1 [Trichinella patagoniensis]|uniref:SNW domain-containing protein 1 n=2 Tax=Trichinella TaxID=6333 RepID=A0A0V1A3N1_9BILA|nr:SNW domain-containing protein 1 [Trichinella murrelli]KRY19397.1 SNW domain-containing protein 1 [Trichinella patagoniensis]